MHIVSLNRVGTARRAVRAAFSGAMVPPAASRAGTSQRDVPTRVRFMGWVSKAGLLEDSDAPVAIAAFAPSTEKGTRRPAVASVRSSGKLYRRLPSWEGVANHTVCHPAEAGC